MIFVYIAIIIAVPLIAELVRFAVVSNLMGNGPVTAVPYILNLTYSENRGVAFGMFQDGTLFFSITTSIVIIVFGIFLIRYYKKSRLFSVAASLIIGGGLANLFERIFYGYVVDYLSLSFFSPICNLADYCITAGTVCLIVYLLFFSDMLKSKKKVKDNDEA